MKKQVLAVLFTLSVCCLTQTPALAGSCPGNCNGHGTCNPDNTCSCFTGFAGTACEFCAPDYYSYPSCTFCQAATTCSGNGSCNVAGSCNCNAGWVGTDCSTPYCAGGCGNGTCGPPGVCTCFAGWTGPMCDQPAAVPTVSQWGLAVLTATGLIAGMILFTRRNKTTSA